MAKNMDPVHRAYQGKGHCACDGCFYGRMPPGPTGKAVLYAIGATVMGLWLLWEVTAWLSV